MDLKVSLKQSLLRQLTGEVTAEWKTGTSKREQNILGQAGTDLFEHYPGSSFFVLISGPHFNSVFVLLQSSHITCSQLKSAQQLLSAHWGKRPGPLLETYFSDSLEHLIHMPAIFVRGIYLYCLALASAILQKNPFLQFGLEHTQTYRSFKFFPPQTSGQTYDC